MQSVRRALDVLFLVAESDRPVTPQSIASQLNLPRPTVYRIIDTLAESGTVARLSDGVVTTPKLATIATSSNVLTFSHTMTPYLQKLVATTKETSGLHVRQGDLRRCVAEVEGYHGIRWARGVGFTAPVWSGAVGHVLLAGMSDDELDATLSRAEFRPRARNTPLDADALRRRVERTRLTGWGTSESETVDGACAIAAPVHDYSGDTVGVLSLYAPSDRFDDIEQFGPDLVAVAKEATDEWVGLTGRPADESASHTRAHT